MASKSQTFAASGFVKVAVCLLGLLATTRVTRAENPVDILMSAATNLLGILGDVFGVLEISGSENGDEFDWEKAIETTRDYLLDSLDEDGSPTKDRLVELGEELKIVPDYAVDVAIAMAHTFKEKRDEDAVDLIADLLRAKAEGSEDGEESGNFDRRKRGTYKSGQRANVLRRMLSKH